MNLEEIFNVFLSDIVNLNQSRIDRLEGHVEAIQTFLEGSGYVADILRFSPQGSWAHRTIIKPLPQKEFDADLVMFVDRHNEWAPKDYVNNLFQVFQSTDRYKDKVSKGTRCVSLDYSGDFHLDVVPCVDDGDDATFEVCNRTEDIFEGTAPEAYTAWLAECNEWTGNDMLCHSVRLLKYLRNIKGTFSVKSILLTTLIGMQISVLDKFQQDKYFSDLATSLKTLVGRLDDYLQSKATMPEVINPVLSEETFNRHWDEEKYQNFRDCIHRYREWIDDAYNETERDESIRKWRRVFGDDFAKGEVIEEASFSESTFLLKITGYSDIVHAVLLKGSAFLDKLISPRLPHVERLPWLMHNQLTVTVRAVEYFERNAHQGIRVLETGQVIEKDRWIRFEAMTHNGFLFPSKDFKVEWQVVNTDKEAAQANALRGKFYPSDEPSVRWESTEYHGAHWVEAFVISRREGKCWGRSGRFFVVVK